MASGIRIAAFARPLLVVLALLAACSPQGRQAPQPGSDPPLPASPAAPPPAQPPGPPVPSSGPSPAGCGAPVCPAEAVLEGTFDVAAATEASGLASSVRTPGWSYVLDDGPGTTGLVVLGPDLAVAGRLEVAGLDGTDTEGLAVGPCPAGSCVLVADVGDNRGSRASVAVWRIQEPDLTAGPPAQPVPAEVVELTYPDGPSDAEALLVDEAGTPLLVTKAPFDPETGVTGESRLLAAPDFADGELVDLGVVPVPAPPVPRQSAAVGTVVTGGDSRPGLVLLRTYDSVLAYVAPDSGAAIAAFPTWPVTQLPSPPLLQSEALALTGDGCSYRATGEAVGEVWLVPCAPAP